MENKIMFLIIAILLLWVIFSQKGQEFLKRIIGIAKGSTAQAVNNPPDLQDDSKYKKYSGGTSGGVSLG
jgi:hypothetical protein